MQKDDLQLLAEIAILGSNNAQTQDAQVIIDAIRLISPEAEISVTTQALNFLNQGKFDHAANILAPWCDKHSAGVAHSLLAMIYWQWGKMSDAERYCRQVLANSEDQSASSLATQIINQMGVTI